MRTLTVLFISTSLFTTPALASDDNCPQEHAIYVETESGAIVHFMPDEDRAVNFDTFTMQLASGEQFNGSITWGTGLSQPISEIRKAECDRDCELWSGVLYELTAEGEIDLYGSNLAAPQILFPELVSALFRYGLENDWETPRRDTFFYSGCSPEAGP